MNQDFGFNDALAQRLLNLVDHIEKNLSGDIVIPELAKQMSLSPWHFQRTFKSLVGDTLGGYVRGRRLTQSAELLLNSQAGVLDIALEVGFNSHEAYTRSFKAFFGLTPKQFRQQAPDVLLNKKPKLSKPLLKHVAEDMHLEPEITTLPEQWVLGFHIDIPSPFAVEDSSCFRIEPTWRKLFAEAPRWSPTVADQFYGLTISPSGHFTEATLTYLAGIPVASPPKELPKDMMTYCLPERTVAKFSVRSVDADSTDRAIDYIYGYWLEKSGYSRAQGIDYDFFDQVESFTEAGFPFYYVLPITRIR